MNRTRLIIDTDPGVDDAVTILLALVSAEIEVLGITVVAGNVPLEATLANACRVVAMSGRRDVPVLAGAAGPLLRDQIFGKYAAIGAFPERLVGTGRVTPAADRAAVFIARQARAAAEAGDPLTICAIGPMTNIALALRLHPDVARGIGRIVCMGGAFTALGNRVAWAEFNMLADPHAAEIVFGAGIPLVLFPLDVTTQALFTAANIARLGETGGKPGRAIAALLTEYDRDDVVRYGRPGGPLHDPMTVAWLLAPELFSGRPARVGIQIGGTASGHVFADFKDDTSATVVMREVDEDGYIGLILDRIARYGVARQPLTADGRTS